MEDSAKQEETAQEVQPEEGEKAEYDLHVIVPEEMRTKLKEAAELAFQLEIIEKPGLVDLMNLFIRWGFAILKKQWLDRVGYK